ncbi:hypothetical protein BIW11_02532 [Tropilaelaps mercedesae]|uniref:Uncharacterized protein n=1 Tax=Tropilaelaps mercedesae TaxID=418985 RepID=A0A1V9Y200_9ACAR|nr:hypothetical protein BIW11_02532 [Tropilaelaps mercedesae]
MDRTAGAAPNSVPSTQWRRSINTGVSGHRTNVEYACCAQPRRRQRKAGRNAIR